MIIKKENLRFSLDNMELKSFQLFEPTIKSVKGPFTPVQNYFIDNLSD